jgi:hypothetical protein
MKRCIAHTGHHEVARTRGDERSDACSDACSGKAQ